MPNLHNQDINTSSNPPERLRPDRMIVNGELMDRLPRRPEREEGQGACPDCGAQTSAYHSTGCDIEICPNCEGRLHRCKCEVYF